MLVIKLDFEKAFDTIEHQAIIDIIRAKGFGEKWNSWIQMIFSTASASLMLNGVLGKKILQKGCQTRRSSLPPLVCVGSRSFTISD